MVVLRLYLGMGLPRGGQVSDVEWRKFKESNYFLLPGCTIYDGEGIWNGSVEQSKVIEVITDEVDEAYPKLREFGVLFKKEFEQYSVLLTRQELAAIELF